MKLLSRSVFFAAALSLSLLSGCTCSRDAELAPGELYMGNGAEPKDLDPHITTGIPEHHIQQNIFEALVSVDPKTLAPVPGVAESWTLAKDGRTYTFKLRADAKWSNGDPVVAQDFVYAWTRLLKPETASEYAYQGYYIVGGKDYNTGKSKEPKLGVEAVDDRTLKVTLVNPTPFFLGLLYHHSLYPVHRKTIEAHGAKWTRPENIVTNGAFRVSRWETNKIITLVPNEHYWDRANVKLKAVHFLPIENLDTEEKMFRSGKLHVTNEVPLEKLPSWQKDTTGVYQSAPYLGTYFYWINTKKKPLDDKRVRKALNLAFDREQLVKHVTKGGQLPGNVFVPPGTGGLQVKPMLPTDLSRVAEAKKLLAEAGYPDGKGMPPLEILYNTHEGHKKIAEALQQMWKTNLGVNVTLFNQEWKVYLDSMRQMQFHLGRQGWIGDYNDPNTFLDLLVSDNGNNRSGFKSAKYDALIEQAGKEHNAAKRLAIFQQAEEMLADELPVIPMYIYTRNYLKRNDVKGWYPNVQDFHPLKYVYIEEEVKK
ncbi:peptide ABC transporter substrate-binding protein [bacterium]|nr:peptide ABC transporter substrate-binding protein [bacterium]